MRAVPIGCMLAFACSKSVSVREDASTSRDATVDAPALPSCENPVRGTTLAVRRLERLASAGTIATAPPGDRRLYVAERSGAIRIFDENRALLPEPFLDLSIDNGGPVIATGAQELGLLGLAFHPAYVANGTFYVFYTREAQPADPVYRFRDVLARCRRSDGDPDRAEPTCVEVLSIRDQGATHNGGMIQFGRDGYLYLGTGDGGGNSRFNAQAIVDGMGDPTSIALLGKILRIDVDHPAAGREYGIPVDNPFATGGGAPEIYALGLRNPWRWSFDPATGDAWISDVGLNTFEEINFVPAGQLAGKNFGWATWEGTRCVNPPCPTEGLSFAQIERTHTPPPDGDGWSAIIGGSVYRGTCFPDLAGTYVYANYGTRTLSLARQEGGSITSVDVAAQPGAEEFPESPTSIHADAFGELYITTTNSGSFYALEVL